MLGRAVFILVPLILIGATALFCCGQGEPVVDQSSRADANTVSGTTMSPRNRMSKELFHRACLETSGSNIERVHNLCEQIDRTTP